MARRTAQLGRGAGAREGRRRCLRGARCGRRGHPATARPCTAGTIRQALLARALDRPLVSQTGRPRLDGRAAAEAGRQAAYDEIGADASSPLRGRFYEALGTFMRLWAKLRPCCWGRVTLCPWLSLVHLREALRHLRARQSVTKRSVWRSVVLSRCQSVTGR